MQGIHQESERNPALARVPAPARSRPRPHTSDLDHAAGVDLREEPEKGPRLAVPDAARRSSARAARGGSFTEADFRRLCVLLRQQRDSDPWAAPHTLVARVEGLAEQVGLPCPPEASARLSAVLDDERLRRRDATRKHELLRRARAVVAHWRDRCAHTPRCATPTACALRSMR